jgi:hypothetical protein
VEQRGREGGREGGTEKRPKREDEASLELCAKESVDLVSAVTFFSRSREMERESVGMTSTYFSISEELIFRDFCEEQ